jgi:hypothetical protein
MRPIRLLVVTVLAVVLMLSSAQSAFSNQWIIYDNDTPENSWNTAEFVGVRFSLPSGFSSARLLTVSFAWAELADVLGSGMLMAIHPSQETPITIHITGVPPGPATELTTPISWTATAMLNSVDVSGRGIVVSGDFYVVIDQGVIPGTIVYDSSGSNVDGRSVYGDTLAGVIDNPCCGEVSRNFMIRAEIGPMAPSGGPVGGYLTPVSKLSVFAPYLALLAVAATVAVAVLAPRKKTHN